MIVADTNIIVYLLIPGEFTDAVQALHAKDPQWVAPASWRVEFFNVLSTYCRAKKLTPDQAITLIELAESIVRDVPMPPAPRQALEASVTGSISGYDSLFVVAAQMNDLPLVTFDKALWKAFPDRAIDPSKVEAWFTEREDRRGRAP